MGLGVDCTLPIVRGLECRGTARTGVQRVLHQPGLRTLERRFRTAHIGTELTHENSQQVHATICIAEFGRLEFLIWYGNFKLVIVGWCGVEEPAIACCCFIQSDLEEVAVAS